jgi:hypothetical protein
MANANTLKTYIIFTTLMTLYDYMLSWVYKQQNLNEQFVRVKVILVLLLTYQSHYIGYSYRQGMGLYTHLEPNYNYPTNPPLIEQSIPGNQKNSKQNKLTAIEHKH